MKREFVNKFFLWLAPAVAAVAWTSSATGFFPVAYPIRLDETWTLTATSPQTGENVSLPLQLKTTPTGDLNGRLRGEAMAGDFKTSTTLFPDGYFSVSVQRTTSTPTPSTQYIQCQFLKTYHGPTRFSGSSFFGTLRQWQTAIETRDNSAYGSCTLERR